MVKVGSTEVGPMQLGMVGILGCVTLFGLYSSARGKPIPLPVTILLFLGMCAAAFYAMQSLEVKEPEPLADVAEDKDEKKRAKLLRKKQQKEEEEFAKEEEKEAKKAAKNALKLAEKKAQKQAEAAKKAREESEKAAAEPAKEDKKAKKKKKKKAPKKEDAAAATTPSAATGENETTEENPEGWVEVPKYAKKATPTSAEGGPTVSSTMLVNPKHYPTIIGPEGTTIARIKDDFGVEVNIPRKNSSDEHITLEGPEASVVAVKQIVNELVDKGYSKTLDGNLADTTMEVENMGLLIGPGGATIKTIKMKTRTKITLPEKGDKENKTISILGDATDVQIASAAIKQLMADGFCSLTHENYVKMEVSFPGSMVGILKGAKGENLRRIQDQTGCRINVPSNVEKGMLIAVSVTGPADGVEAARRAIVTVQTDHKVRELDFPANLVPFFMGPSGSNISAVQKATNTRIDVSNHIWDPSMKTISISGFDKDILTVERELATLTQTYTVWKYDFPASRTRNLYGKGGAAIRDLQTSTATRIDVKDHDWDDLVKEVTVIGTVVGVTEAKALIEALAKPPAPRAKQETVPVEA